MISIHTTNRTRAAAFCIVLVLAASVAIESRAQQDSPPVLKHVPGQTLATVSLWPRQLLASPMMRLAPLEVMSATGKESFGIDPMMIERVDVLVGFPGPAGSQFGALIQSLEAMQSEGIAPDMLDGQGWVDEGGFKYLGLRGPQDLIIHQVDAKLAIVGTKVFVKQMVKNSVDEGQIQQMLSQANARQDALALVSISQLRPLLGGFVEGAPLPPPLVKDVLSLIDSIESLALRISISEEDKLQLLLSATDEAAAKQAQASLDRVLMFARDTYIANSKQQVPDDSPTGAAMHKYLDRMGAEFTRMTQARHKGNRLLIEIEDFQDVSLIGSLTGALLPAIGSARMAAGRMQSSNNLKQFALALHNFHDSYGAFPAAAGLDNKGEPMISWRVAILPFIGEQALYQKFNLDEPWDSEHNLALLEEMPEVFKHPSRQTKVGYTVYQAPVGDDTLMRLKEPSSFRDITDGTSNTIMLLATSSERSVPWTAPQDFEIDPDNPKTDLFFDGVSEVALGDGSVQALPETLDAATIKALFTRAGGEVVRF